MSIWLTSMGNVLRSAGLSVIEMPGWQTAANPNLGGFVEPPSYIMCHHTASNPNTDPNGDLNYIQFHFGHALASLYLSRTGTFYVIAAGRVATNGAGSSTPWNGGVPDDMMNHYAISIEAANTGIGEPWPDIQINSYVTGVAALCTAYNIPVEHVRAHFEWAPTRKIDPAGQSPYATGRAKWNMDAFRRDVSAIVMFTPNVPIEPPLSTEEHEMETLDPPYRTDTRNSNTPLVAGEVRRIAVMMGGKAVQINLTVVPLTNESGFLVAFNDIHSSPPTTSNVNWSNGRITANLALIPTNGGWIKVMATQKCHLITDTQGYTV